MELNLLNLDFILVERIKVVIDSAVSCLLKSQSVLIFSSANKRLSFIFSLFIGIILFTSNNIEYKHYPSHNSADPLKSTFEIDLSGILMDIDKILPQFTHFLDLFKSTIIENNTNVVIDASGSMSIDVPANMSDDQARELSKKLNVIDSLIHSRNDELEKLIQEGNRIESELLQKIPNINPKF